MRAVLEDGLSGRVGIRQHGSIDVDDDLVSLTRSAGIQAVVERGFGEQHERVCLLLRR